MIEHRRIYKLISLLLALLIGLTSIGFSVDLHYCQGKLSSIVLIGGDCCGDDSINSCSKKLNDQQLNSNLQKNCCSNTEVFLQNEDDRQLVWQFTTNPDIEKDIHLINQNWGHVSEFRVYDAADYEHYRPPLIPKDRSVLFSSFLL